VDAGEVKRDVYWLVPVSQPFQQKRTVFQAALPQFLRFPQEKRQAFPQAETQWQ
jgi:hypothetical protein